MADSRGFVADTRVDFAISPAKSGFFGNRHGADGNRGKTPSSSSSAYRVLIGVSCPPDRDRRDEPGGDEPATMRFAPVTADTAKAPLRATRSAMLDFNPAGSYRTTPDAVLLRGIAGA